jgi:hypothetical protein
MRPLSPAATTIEDFAVAVGSGVFAADDRWVAIPIQTTAMDASKAVATIFKCVITPAWLIDEFMTRS